MPAQTLDPRVGGPLRERRSTEREIYDAALELIYERGYHGTSLRAVAARVGLQMASLYYHYPSKQDLLMAIMRRAMEDLTATVRQAVDGLDDPTLRLGAAIRGHVLFHADRRMEAFVTDAELRSLTPANRDSIVGLRDAYETIFADTLREGVRRGAFAVPDVKLATLALMALCTGVATWFRPGGRLSLEDVADGYTRLFLLGALPTAGRGTNN